MSIIDITNGILSARLSAPGELYSRTRFDWTGFVISISHDGHVYSAPEKFATQPGGSTGGVGLNNEYSRKMPFAWEDTPEDGSFMKLGVGVLKKLNNGDYSFMYDYPVEKSFPVEYEAKKDSVSFVTLPVPFMGYAARQERTVSLNGNRLIITTTLTNCGEKLIDCAEYNHNFLAIDHLGVHPGVTLTQPKGFTCAHPEWEEVLVDNTTLKFSATPRAAFMCFNPGPVDCGGMRWELIDETAKAGVREYGDFAVSAFNTWTREQVISPEVFIKVELSPGQSMTWTREWEFFSL